jgi:hypothetical protein
MFDRVALDHERPALARPLAQHDALGEGLLELRDRDRRALQQAEHVDEPQPDEAHAVLLGAAKHVVNGGRFGPQRVSSEGTGRQSCKPSAGIDGGLARTAPWERSGCDAVRGFIAAADPKACTGPAKGAA